MSAERNLISDWLTLPLITVVFHFMSRPYGQDHRNAVLTNQTAEVIRERHREGESQAPLAREYDVSVSTIRRIVKLQAYYDGPKPGTAEYFTEKIAVAAIGALLRAGEATIEGAKAFAETFSKTFTKRD